MSKQILRTVSNTQQRDQFMRVLFNREYPYTVSVKNGDAQRSTKQNRLQWQWFNDLSIQGDQSPEDYRAYCKLRFGVPILRAECEEFREQYDRVVGALPYETRLDIMRSPIDLQVTSLMTVKQKTQYLNDVWDFFTERGYQLTDPTLLGLASYLEVVRT